MRPSITALRSSIAAAFGAILLLLTAVGGSASTDGQYSLSKSGLSAARVANIQRLLDSAVTDGRIPAAVAMLARDGEIAWLGTAGTMTDGVPMRDDAILPLASVGKMFTAVALMILVERGELSLDDEVSRYLPEFADVAVMADDPGRSRQTEPPDRPITIYHLLTHTAGLTVTGDEFWVVWDRHVGKTTTAHFARDLAALPLHAQPGERYRYGQTGASYEVLAAVIEIVSGQTLEAFMTANIFELLGLEDTYFYLPESKAERLPEVYRRVDGRLALDRALGEDFTRSTFFHGGGGVRTSATDVLHFARLFLDGGEVDGVRILRGDTVDLMMRDHLGDKAPERWKSRSLSWGFGAAVEYAAGGVAAGRPRKYGWVGGGFAKLWIKPRERIVAYINFPLAPPGDNDLLAEFERRVDAALTEPVDALVTGRKDANPQVYQNRRGGLAD